VRERLADNEPCYVGGVKVFQGCEDNPFHLNTHGTERLNFGQILRISIDKI
jgi:hypothetical protein